MSGRNSFKELRDRIERDPVRRRRMEEKKKAYDVLLNLADLRQKRGVTQAELAEALGVSQPNVSKIEVAVGSGKSQVLLDTLARYVEAIGGRLEVRVSFPDHPGDDIAVRVGSFVESPVGVRAGDGAGDPDERD